MECVYVVGAEYTRWYRVYLRFNTGESGEVDLREIIFKYKAAAPLRQQRVFANFYLDSWPTLAWKCGFDIAPESLYALAIGEGG